MENEKIVIRRAVACDLPAIMRIYDAARQFMRSQGNATQWSGGYPSVQLIESDILSGVCHVGCLDSVPHFVFALIGGEDPTYTAIEAGEWLNDDAYHTLHRLASDGFVSGVLDRCIEFCSSVCGNLRADTHACNAVMLAGLERNGFSRCGIIHVADGTPRIAFQRSVTPLRSAQCQK